LVQINLTDLQYNILVSSSIEEFEGSSTEEFGRGNIKKFEGKYNTQNY
jgi:hypothetical protein